jgi:hypothetical protein
MKKLTLLFAIALIASPFIASAATGDFVPIAPIPGLTEGVDTTSASMTAFLNNIYKFLLGFAAVTAVVMIIWGGLEYATTDSIGNKSEGKAKIQQAILGLILVLLPVLVFSIINPKILDLGVNWRAITPPSNIGTINTGAGGVAQVPVPTSGCTTTHTGPYLESALCANTAAAGSYTCQNGLTLRVPTCRLTNPDGTCRDTSATAHCAGRTTTLIYYAYYHSVAGILDPLVSIIPRDQPAESTFAQGCQTDGGTVSKNNTTAGTAFIASHAYQVSSGCPSDSDVIVDTARGRGVACWSKVLECNPPN